METKTFYHQGIWKEIVNHPGYDLGRREQEALVRFLPEVASHTPRRADVLHLASSTGREVSAIVSAIVGVQTYLLNDIVQEVVEQSCRELQEKFPDVQFLAVAGDIESASTIAELRNKLINPTLIALVANGVIFSNRTLDDKIARVMGRDDLFLVTVETPHEQMSQSYTIEPVYKLLARSGLDVNASNTKTWYDENDQCFKMSCHDEILLSSYKPKPDQLRQRMKEAEMAEVVLCEYQDVHMVAGLFKAQLS